MEMMMIKNDTYDDDNGSHDNNHANDQDDGPRQPRWTSAQCERAAQSRLQWDGQGHHAG